jgi:hypothetical protein
MMAKSKKVLAVTVAAASLTFAGAGIASANSATAIGSANGSPGVLSGNNVQIPINIPINFCGNSIDVLGLLNPSVGNVCVNG